MKTVADPAVLADLTARLGRLRGDSARRWGSLSAHEMLCHLGDSTAMALGTRPALPPAPSRRRRLFKALALWSPLRWPHGIRTRPVLDPRAEGTRPAAFGDDLARVIDGLQRVAAAAPEALIASHVVFGAMTLRDWQRWAYKHTDHHLRQFGA
ncbi:MAG TPA: DUF1569 domain-containing protein [Vicinamibacteria bacterium]|nr:DUF1569 domain-containing protein [Vicinamibacteria bacterium]